jgi:osmotically-inducible protein OsmY
MSQAIKKSDTQIHHDVLEELKWDSRVDETEVGVQVAGGVVTLTGTVTSWAKRVAAQEAARRVIGVLDVANDIAVKVPGGFMRSDTEIAQAVRQALEWDVFVPNERITSTVTDGWVTLEGPVERGSQRDDAERAVRNLTGVKMVVNKITVTPAKPMDRRRPQGDRAGPGAARRTRGPADRRRCPGRHRDPDGAGPFVGGAQIGAGGRPLHAWCPRRRGPSANRAGLEPVAWEVDAATEIHIADDPCPLNTLTKPSGRIGDGV